MRADLITIFPRIFSSYLEESLFRRAREKKIIDVRVHDLRAYSTSRHKKVDDRPFGGGPGMVVQIEPVYRAVSRIAPAPSKKRRIILLSPRGKVLTGPIARRLARYEQLVFICGRYEGVDERVATHIADEVISIGDYVLSGGELAALVVLEAVSRFVPGFLGTTESLEDTRGSYPAYSRPEVFVPRRGIRWSVPKDLLSGDHKRIHAWRARTSRSQ